MPDVSEVRLESSSGDKSAASMLGWAALAMGLVLCFIGVDPPASHLSFTDIRHQTYKAAVFGMAAAIIVGIALRAVRLNFLCWPGWLALSVNGAFIMWSIDRVTRPFRL